MILRRSAAETAGRTRGSSPFNDQQNGGTGIPQDPHGRPVIGALQRHPIGGDDAIVDSTNERETERHINQPYVSWKNFLESMPLERTASKKREREGDFSTSD